MADALVRAYENDYIETIVKPRRELPHPSNVFAVNRHTILNLATSIKHMPKQKTLPVSKGRVRL